MSYNQFFQLNFALCFLLVFVKTAIGQGCDFNGVSCISCTEYQMCSAGFPQGRIVSCSGKSCSDDNLKQCQKKLNCFALIECTQAGIFPDVMVESNYFVCLSDGATGFLKYEFTCPDEQFFDQSGKNCIPKTVTAADPPTDPTTEPTTVHTTVHPTDSPTEPTTGPTTVPPTDSPTEPTTVPTTVPPTDSPTEPTTGPTTVPSTDSPTEPTTGPTTVPPIDPTTEPTTGPTTVLPTDSTTVPSSPAPTVPPTESPPFVCSGPGIFPNPDNCKMYYRCSTSRKLFYYVCPGSSYFNNMILKCSMMITPECQKQILKNSTTIAEATSTTLLPPKTSTTTTATPKPSTTTTTTLRTPSPSTTTTTTTTQRTPSPSPTPNAPFSCPMAGTFENPTDCKTYYRCSTSNKAFRYVCPGATYFNEITKRCSLTVTSRCKKLIQV